MALSSGSILNNRYRIDGQLGKGGMGTVYLAYDQTLQLKVAVKENLNPDPDSAEQFKREARMLASLRHPNLPRVTDHFILGDTQYLVMDFIEGQDLQAVLARQRPNVSEVLRWADDVCDALTFLHTRVPPIIHRDIKPGNLKLQPDGRVVLVDFGIAKAFTQDQTATGARGMTPGFSPPEQFGGTGTDHRSDLYALAATIYYLLTRKQPANSIDRMLKQDVLKRPRELNPEIPAAVDAALLHALALPKDERFPDVETFKSALHGGADLETVRAGGLPQTIRRGVPILAIVGLVAVAAVVIGGGALSGLLGGLAPDPEPSQPVGGELTGTPTRTTSETPAPTATSFDTPIPTDAPTDTPVPTDTAVPVVLGGGGRIALASDRSESLLQIWTINPDGSNPQQLTFDPGDKTQPRWSPDGTRLLYVAPGGTDQFGAQLGLDLWVINADGTGIAKVTSSPGDDFDPAWSPDGAQIAFTSTRANDLRQVFVMDASCLDEPEGCEDQKPSNVSCHVDWCAVEFSPAWAPAGVELPEWLPTDHVLAVLASINQAPAEVFLRPTYSTVPIDWDRRNQIRNLADLRWSPDGAFFAFTWFYQRGANEVYVAALSDRAATFTQLTSTNGNKEPTFSPDGQFVAFSSTREGKPDIFVMTVGGGNQTNITNSPASRDMQPDWQPLPTQ